MNKKRLWNSFNCDMLSETRGCMSPNKCEYAEECKHNWQLYIKKLNRYNTRGMDLDWDSVRFRKFKNGEWVKFDDLKEIILGVPNMNTIGEGDESEDGIHSFRYCNGWNDCLNFVKQVLNI